MSRFRKLYFTVARNVKTGNFDVFREGLKAPIMRGFDTKTGAKEAARECRKNSCKFVKVL